MLPNGYVYDCGFAFRKYELYALFLAVIFERWQINEVRIKIIK